MAMGEETFRITEIEPQKHHKNRVNIYLDGAFAFGLNEETVIQQHLHEEDVITADMIDDILLVEERTRAREKALALLAYRARSIEEMSQRLKEKQYSERTIQRIIDDFVRVGLLDDEKFASAFAQTKMVQKPIGKRLLRQELLSRGIQKDIIEETIHELYSGRSEKEWATELIRRRLKNKTTADQRLRKRLTDLLLRRGFDWNVIGDVLPKELGDHSSPET